MDNVAGGSGQYGASADPIIGAKPEPRCKVGFRFPRADVIADFTGDGLGGHVPNWNPGFKGKVIVGKPDQWYDPRAFVLPLQGTFGNVGRSALLGPGLFTVDTSFLKKIRVSEGLNV